MRTPKLSLPPSLALLLCLFLFAAGCGGPAVSEEDWAAIDKALVAYWQKRDAKAKTTLKEVSIEGDRASIKFLLKYPEFHSISTTREGVVVKKGGVWSVAEVSEERIRTMPPPETVGCRGEWVSTRVAVGFR